MADGKPTGWRWCQARSSPTLVRLSDPGLCSAAAWRTCVGAAACLVLLVGGLGARGAERQRVSRAEFERTLKPLIAQATQAIGRLEALSKQESELMDEVKPAGQKQERSLDQIRADLEVLHKKIAKEDKRLREAKEGIHRAKLAFFRSGCLVISGNSKGCFALAELYDEFRRSLDPKVSSGYPRRVESEMLGSDTALKSLMSGDAEVAVVDEPLTDDEGGALKKAFKRQPQNFAFCRHAVAIVVHADNPVPGLTMDQVEQIYRAESVKQWSAVGGAAQKIDRIGGNSGYMLFAGQILHYRSVEFPDKFKYDPNHLPNGDELDRLYEDQQSRFPGGGPFPCYEKDAKFLDEVAKHPQAIGYCKLTPSLTRTKNVRVVPIAHRAGEAPVAPLHDGALADAYPLQERIWLLVRPGASDSTQAFVKYCTSAKAVHTIQEQDLWPDGQIERK